MTTQPENDRHREHADHKPTSDLKRRELLQRGMCALGTVLLPLTESLAQGGRGGGGGRGRGGEGRPIEVDPDNPAIAYYRNRCERCGDCTTFCQNVTTVNGWTGPDVPYPCIYCGQCTLICPGRAMTEKYDYPEVGASLQDEKRVKVASFAPSLRVSISEACGLIPGTDVQNKLIQGLRQCGFDYVLDISFAADVVVMEEAKELVARLSEPKPRPLFTSCCPSWIRFAELFYPEVLPYLSTVKSPILIHGALVKTWFARKHGLDPSQIVNVVAAPCTAKKYEITRPEASSAARFAKNESMARDVDYALTTRETAFLLKQSGIERLPSLKSGEFDSLLGLGSGAGMIFGASGGVMQASLRTAWWLLNESDPPESLLEWDAMKGEEPVKTATVDLKKKKLRVAVVQGAANIRRFLDKAKADGMQYDFVEMMACPGGCIGGGGQPYTAASSYESLRRRRATGLYRRDERNELRLSYKNPEITALYKEFLDDGNKEVVEKLLHVTR